MSEQGGSAQTGLDTRNAAFWDELCGSSLARQLGIEDASAESLRRFDEAYMGHYPYLPRYMDHPLAGKDLLEIGLGYGTLSGQLIARGANYHGLDIAEGPVEMVRHRLRLAGASDPEPERRVKEGSALEIPFADASFDYLYSIGCLHHTGNLPRSIQEVGRVLRPGGTAVVMLYNKHSYRRLIKVALPALLRRGRSGDEVAALYDTNAAGDAAPHTDYVSAADVRRLFGSFSSVDIERRNFDNLRYVRRARLLGNVDRVLGLDLYVTAGR